MCQALLSLRIEPASDGELRSALTRVQLLLARFRFMRSAGAGQTIDAVANIVCRPAIRARTRRKRRRGLAYCIAKIEDVVLMRDRSDPVHLVDLAWQIAKGCNLTVMPQAANMLAYGLR